MKRFIFSILFSVLSINSCFAHVPPDHYSRNNFSDVYVRDSVVRKGTFKYFGAEPTNNLVYVSYVVGYAVPVLHRKIIFNIPRYFPEKLCYISGNNEPFYSGWNFNAPLDSPYERTCR